MATKYIALHTISVTVEPGQAKTATTPARRPKIKEIVPGTHLVLDDQDQIDELLEAKAIRKFTKDDGKAAQVENLSDLSEEQQAAADAEQARIDAQANDENARRAANAQAALDAGTGKATTTTKAAGKAAAKAGKPAPSAAAAAAADKDAKDGDTGAAGTGGNKDGTGTNEGANTTVDANDNAAGTDDGGLV